MKDILKDRKKLALLIGSIILLFAVIIVLVIVINNNNSKKTTETLEEGLKKIGIEFYEKKYYPTFEDKKQLANFKDTGLSISVNNLNVTLPIHDELKGKLNKKKCDLNNTKIMIFPKESYGADDYSIKVELDCEK